MKRYQMITALLSATYFLSGCVKEEVGFTPQPQPDGDVSVTMNIPVPRTVGTYAMNAKQECDVSTVDVLVFGPDDKFLYREMGTDITDGATNNKKVFSVKIKKTTVPNKVSAFVYANVRSQIDAALVGSSKWITPGSTTKATVIEKLVFDLPTDQTAEKQGGRWLVMPGRYTRFPMWGQTGDIDLAKPSVVIPEVNMLRSVAKIDVGLAFPTSGAQDKRDVAAGLNNFFLEEFYLYNASNKLQVAPTTTKLDGSGTKVTSPSVPAGAGVFGSADQPISYKRRGYNPDGYKSFMSEIYLAEHAAGSKDKRPTNVCIVVGGRFGTKTDKITYYRIDMVRNTTGSTGEITAQEYLAMLRNHRYKVNITAVHGRGYTTAKEAFSAMGLNTNLDVVITSQDEKVNDMLYDGQYMMGVDRKKVTVDKRAHTNREIYINTDYPDGWKATAVSTGNWLTVNTAKGAKGGSTMKFSVTENTGGQERAGRITIQAGRLSMDIEVAQSNVADIEFANVRSEYIMDTKNCTFTVKSNYNWKVRVEDEYNIVIAFDLSGVANASGAMYNFKLVNDLAMGVLRDKEATLTFYSENDDFSPETVIIRGKTYFDIANLHVYPYDQPTGQTWYTYANYNSQVNNTTIPGPGTAGQAKPPVANSCASLPKLGGGEWRLPTVEELENISAAARNPASNLALYNFTSGVYYWSATSGNAYNANYVNVSTGVRLISGKTSTGNRARCVRSK